MTGSHEVRGSIPLGSTKISRPLARVIHQRRMACPDPTRVRRQIACWPPQASLGRSVEEAGA
jgi:hypothetical protein